MKKTTWFKISGLNVCVAHNEITREIWDNYEWPKSEQARKAIVDCAIILGFDMPNCSSVEDAFLYLKDKFPGAHNSWIIREAISYSLPGISTS